MKRSAGYFLLLLMVVPVIPYAQNELHVVGDIYYENDPLPNAMISIDEDTIHFGSHQSNNNGKFYFNLQYQHNYTITFSKPGFMSKKIQINTDVPDFIDPGGNQVVAIKLELMKATGDMPDVPSVLGIVKFNMATKEFSYQSKYNRNTFTNIQMAGLDSFEADEYRNLIPEEVKEETVDIDIPAISYEDDMDQRKNEYYEDIVNKRNQMVDKDTLMNKEELSLLKADKEIPFDTTINKYEHHHMKVTEIIINNDKILRIYHRVKHDWGAVFYFKNYRSISKAFFTIETNLKN